MIDVTTLWFGYRQNLNYENEDNYINIQKNKDFLIGEQRALGNYFTYRTIFMLKQLQNCYTNTLQDKKYQDCAIFQIENYYRSQIMELLDQIYGTDSKDQEHEQLKKKLQDCIDQFLQQYKISSFKVSYNVINQQENYFQLLQHIFDEDNSKFSVDINQEYSDIIQNYIKDIQDFNYKSNVFDDQTFYDDNKYLLERQGQLEPPIFQLPLKINNFRQFIIQYPGFLDIKQCFDDSVEKLKNGWNTEVKVDGNKNDQNDIDQQLYLDIFNNYVMEVDVILFFVQSQHCYKQIYQQLIDLLYFSTQQLYYEYLRSIVDFLYFMKKKETYNQINELVKWIHDQSKLTEQQMTEQQIIEQINIFIKNKDYDATELKQIITNMCYELKEQFQFLQFNNIVIYYLIIQIQFVKSTVNWYGIRKDFQFKQKISTIDMLVQLKKNTKLSQHQLIIMAGISYNTNTELDFEQVEKENKENRRKENKRKKNKHMSYVQYIVQKVNEMNNDVNTDTKNNTDNSYNDQYRLFLYNILYNSSSEITKLIKYVDSSSIWSNSDMKNYHNIHDGCVVKIQDFYDQYKTQNNNKDNDTIKPPQFKKYGEYRGQDKQTLFKQDVRKLLQYRDDIFNLYTKEFGNVFKFKSEQQNQNFKYQLMQYQLQQLLMDQINGYVTDGICVNLQLLVEFFQEDECTTTIQQLYIKLLQQNFTYQQQTIVTSQFFTYITMQQHLDNIPKDEQDRKSFNRHKIEVFIEGNDTHNIEQFRKLYDTIENKSIFQEEKEINYIFLILQCQAKYGKGIITNTFQLQQKEKIQQIYKCVMDANKQDIYPMYYLNLLLCNKERLWMQIVRKYQLSITSIEMYEFITNEKQYRYQQKIQHFLDQCVTNKRLMKFLFQCQQCKENIYSFSEKIKDAGQFKQDIIDKYINLSDRIEQSTLDDMLKKSHINNHFDLILIKQNLQKEIRFVEFHNARNSEQSKKTKETNDDQLNCVIIQFLLDLVFLGIVKIQEQKIGNEKLKTLTTHYSIIIQENLIPLQFYKSRHDDDIKLIDITNGTMIFNDDSNLIIQTLDLLFHLNDTESTNQFFFGIQQKIQNKYQQNISFLQQNSRTLEKLHKINQNEQNQHYQQFQKILQKQQNTFDRYGDTIQLLNQQKDITEYSLLQMIYIMATKQTIGYYMALSDQYINEKTEIKNYDAQEQKTWIDKFMNGTDDIEKKLQKNIEFILNQMTKYYKNKTNIFMMLNCGQFFYIFCVYINKYYRSSSKGIIIENLVREIQQHNIQITTDSYIIKEQDLIESEQILQQIDEKLEQKIQNTYNYQNFQTQVQNNRQKLENTNNNKLLLIGVNGIAGIKKHVQNLDLINLTQFEIDELQGQQLNDIEFIQQIKKNIIDMQTWIKKDFDDKAKRYLQYKQQKEQFKTDKNINFDKKENLQNVYKQIKKKLDESKNILNNDSVKIVQLQKVKKQLLINDEQEKLQKFINFSPSGEQPCFNVQNYQEKRRSAEFKQYIIQQYKKQKNDMIEQHMEQIRNDIAKATDNIIFCIKYILQTKNQQLENEIIKNFELISENQSSVYEIQQFLDNFIINDYVKQFLNDKILYVKNKETENKETEKQALTELIKPRKLNMVNFNFIFDLVIKDKRGLRLENYKQLNQFVQIIQFDIQLFREYYIIKINELYGKNIEQYMQINNYNEYFLMMNFYSRLQNLAQNINDQILKQYNFQHDFIGPDFKFYIYMSQYLCENVKWTEIIIENEIMYFFRQVFNTYDDEDEQQQKIISAKYEDITLQLRQLIQYVTKTNGQYTQVQQFLQHYQHQIQESITCNQSLYFIQIIQNLCKLVKNELITQWVQTQQEQKQFPQLYAKQKNMWEHLYDDDDDDINNYQFSQFEKIIQINIVAINNYLQIYSVERIQDLSQYQQNELKTILKQLSILEYLQNELQNEKSIYKNYFIHLEKVNKILKGEIQNINNSYYENFLRSLNIQFASGVDQQIKFDNFQKVTQKITGIVKEQMQKAIKDLQQNEYYKIQKERENIQSNYWQMQDDENKSQYGIILLKDPLHELIDNVQQDTKQEKITKIDQQLQNNKKIMNDNIIFINNSKKQNSQIHQILYADTIIQQNEIRLKKIKKLSTTIQQIQKEIDEDDNKLHIQKYLISAILQSKCLQKMQIIEKNQHQIISNIVRLSDECLQSLQKQWPIGFLAVILCKIYCLFDTYEINNSSNKTLQSFDETIYQIQNYMFYKGYKRDQDTAEQIIGFLNHFYETDTQRDMCYLYKQITELLEQLNLEKIFQDVDINQKQTLLNSIQDIFKKNTIGKKQQNIQLCDDLQFKIVESSKNIQILDQTQIQYYIQVQLLNQQLNNIRKSLNHIYNLNTNLIQQKTQTWIENFQFINNKHKDDEQKFKQTKQYCEKYVLESINRIIEYLQIICSQIIIIIDYFDILLKFQKDYEKYEKDQKNPQIINKSFQIFQLLSMDYQATNGDGSYYQNIANNLKQNYDDMIGIICDLTIIQKSQNNYHYQYYIQQLQFEQFRQRLTDKIKNIEYNIKQLKIYIGDNKLSLFFKINDDFQFHNIGQNNQENLNKYIDQTAMESVYFNQQIKQNNEKIDKILQSQKKIPGNILTFYQRTDQIKMLYYLYKDIQDYQQKEDKKKDDPKKQSNNVFANRIKLTQYDCEQFLETKDCNHGEYLSSLSKELNLETINVALQELYSILEEDFIKNDNIYQDIIYMNQQNNILSIARQEIKENIENSKKRLKMKKLTEHYLINQSSKRQLILVYILQIYQVFSKILSIKEEKKFQQISTWEHYLTRNEKHLRQQLQQVGNQNLLAGQQNSQYQGQKIYIIRPLEYNNLLSGNIEKIEKKQIILQGIDSEYKNYELDGYVISNYCIFTDQNYQNCIQNNCVYYHNGFSIFQQQIDFDTENKIKEQINQQKKNDGLYDVIKNVLCIIVNEYSTLNGSVEVRLIKYDRVVGSHINITYSVQNYEFKLENQQVYVKKI